MDDTTAVPASSAPDTTEEKKRLTKLERLQARHAAAAQKALAALERQQLIEQEIKREAALAAKAARKADARMKIVLGGALLALLDHGSEDARTLILPLTSAVADRDRKAAHDLMKARWKSKVARTDG